MIDWNDDNKKKLLSCGTDVNAMMKMFPEGNKLSLKRRAAEFRHHVIGSSADIEVEKDMLKHQYESSKKIVNDKYKTLLDRIDVLTEERNAAISLSKTVQEFKIEKAKNVKSESTAVVLCSDWHIEEIVRAESVNFSNEFNLDIAENRVRKLFQNVVKLIEMNQTSTTINNLVLGLLGDFISGNITEEFAENTSLRPIDAILKAADLLSGGIQYLLDNTKCNIKIVCTSSNHPRITKKIHISNENGNNLEYILFHMLRMKFESRRVKFLISESYHAYVDVYNCRLRFHHGHFMKYNGGIGGLTIPAKRAIAQWNIYKPADIDCLSDDTEILTINGFKKYGEIAKGDYIYNLNLNTNHIEVDIANEVIMRKHNDDIYNFKNTYCDMLLTGNHRFLYSATHNKNKKLVFKTAEELSHYKMEIDVPVAGHYISPTKVDLTDSQIALTGWIISGGTFDTSGLRIWQKKKENIDKIRNIIQKCGYEFSENENNNKITGFNIFAKHKKDILKFIPSKNIPEWVNQLNIKQFNIFLDAMIGGDGNWIGENGAASYYSINEDLINRLQIALILHGRRTYKYYKRSGFKNGCWVVGLFPRTTTRVALHKRMPTRSYYVGNVWCLNTNNGTLICKRNNKVFITGNCFGHFHTMNDGGNFLSNGSLIGYNPFAIYIKAPHEKPQQTFFIIHSKYGKAGVNPIFLD